eukprot:236138_1
MFIDYDELFLMMKLPSLLQRYPNKKTLLIKKLKICSYPFKFNVEQSERECKAKEMKTSMLYNIFHYLCAPQTLFDEDQLQSVVKMVSGNLFRSLQPSKDIFFNIYEPEIQMVGDDCKCPENEITYEPWEHLDLVYRIFSSIFAYNRDKSLHKYVTETFLLSFIDLLNSDVVMERDYVKDILQQMYKKCIALRSVLLKSIRNVFYTVIYHGTIHNGMKELLEIFGTMINDFEIPLSDEHRHLLCNILIPLHKTERLYKYHYELVQCVLQFILKDPKLSIIIIANLLKYWPDLSCSKQILFLSELEKVLTYTPITQFETISIPVFKRIATCTSCAHFKVAEQA